VQHQLPYLPFYPFPFLFRIYPFFPSLFPSLYQRLLSCLCHQFLHHRPSCRILYLYLYLYLLYLYLYLCVLRFFFFRVFRVFRVFSIFSVFSVFSRCSINFHIFRFILFLFFFAFIRFFLLFFLLFISVFFRVFVTSFFIIVLLVGFFIFIFIFIFFIFIFIFAAAAALFLGVFLLGRRSGDARLSQRRCGRIRFAIAQRVFHVLHVSVHQSRRHFVLDFGEFFHGSFGSGSGDARIDDRRQEGHRRHDRIARLTERNRLECQRTQRSSHYSSSDSCPSAGTTELDILEEGIFDGQTQKVENALVLSPGADVLANFVPIVFVELQSFEQQQRFLLRPLPGRLVLQHRTFAIVLVQFQTEIVVAVGIPLAVRST